MPRALKNIIRNSVTAFAVTLFFVGCSSRGDEVKRLSYKMDGPTSEGTGINFKYTDSGKVSIHLKASYFKEFSNDDFPYREFPNGIDLTFYEVDGGENHITSDYAISYEGTGLIDLQSNVVLVTKDSVTLKASQLYWDQNHNWVFTDQPYTIITEDGSTNNGDLFDSNEDFTNFVSLNNIGKQYLKEEKLNDTLQ